jgi:uncharacterized cupin superfamily protein
MLPSALRRYEARSPRVARFMVGSSQHRGVKMKVEKSPALAIFATDVPPRTTKSSYPAPFAARVSRRTKRTLGEFFGLRNFGVNLTTLEPGGESSLLHRHTQQDEFIYILEGHATLRTGTEEIDLGPGMCAGFPAGGTVHQLVNRTQESVVYLEIGDRTLGDVGEYPEDDLVAELVEGRWVFSRKDGSVY